MILKEIVLDSKVMAKLIHELSVFFPAYNEEENIKKTIENARTKLLKVAEKWEILIVNDGSTDRTGEISKKLADGDKQSLRAGTRERIKVITHKENRGYGAGLKTGLYNCRYEWIAYTDSDGQFDFSEIASFIKTQKKTGADLVIGYYLDRKVSFYRKLNTFLWKIIVYLIFRLNVRDVDTGFKLISKEVIDKIPKLESERGAFIESEMLIKAKKAGFKIVQIGVHHYPRVAGHGTGANINVIIDSFLDLFRLWKKLR